jgi:hypothetical protein
LQELIACDFGGDYPADAVVLYLVSNCEDSYPELSRMLEHCRRLPGIGFECRVNRDAAMQWLSTFRPGLLVEKA